jgi:glycogen debranching enzyme
VEPRQVTILHGTTFVVSDVSGDVQGSPQQPEGLFYRDMRHLSRWQVRLNGRPSEAVGAETLGNHEAVFLLIPGTGTIYRTATVTLLRHRRVGRGMRESFALANHGAQPQTLELSVLFDADFADIFQVKDGSAAAGDNYHRLGDGEVTIGHERDDFRRETRIRAEGAAFTEETLTFRVTVAGGETWHGAVELTLSSNQPGTGVPTDEQDLTKWLAAAPTLHTPHEHLHLTYRQSLLDLAALRFHLDSMPDPVLPAAGLPWFMALFGRDSLIVGYQALPFTPVLCRDALRALAACQADRFDDFRDAEPGKIPHELRHGELTHFHERPQSPYYGSADATPLFLIVLDEYERWTGDVDLARDLEPTARAALRWIEEYGDLDGDGFIEYHSRNPQTGLVNQCWKDSRNSVLHPDGRLAKLPRATCEIQGYAYDARLRTARLARECWGDPQLADRLERDAAELNRRFQDAFWLPEEGFYALALDGDDRPVRTLTSNMGHLLWSGLVPDERVDSVVGHLMGDAMFSGWGIRTLAVGQRAYSPMEYHNGTVWPHDNALIAAGLARYGRRAEAGRVTQAVLEAAGHFGHRLPEALVGLARETTTVPMRYPTACSPQAWASGAPLLLLRVLLGLEPAADGPRVDPWVPDALAPIRLDGVPGRWGRARAG